MTCRIIVLTRRFSIGPDFEHKVKTFSGIFSSFVWLGAITGQNSLQFLPLMRPDYESAQTDPSVSTTSLSFRAICSVIRYLVREVVTTTVEFVQGLP